MNEIQTMAARGYADTAMKHAKSQVVRDLEALRTRAKNISDDTNMITIIKQLSEVAVRGANNIKKHMTNERKQNIVQATAQQMDTRIQQEIGRFLNGSESATLSSAKSIASVILNAIHIQSDIAKDMGNTLNEVVSVLVLGLISTTKARLHLFKLWWYLQENIDEAMNRGLTAYDNKIEESPCKTPDVTMKYREELKRSFEYMKNDYAECNHAMGLKMFGHSCMIICVASAGISLTTALTGATLSAYLCGDSVIVAEVVPFLTSMGPIGAYVAMSALGIAIIIGGCYYFFGGTDQSEAKLKRWKDLIEDQ